MTHIIVPSSSTPGSTQMASRIVRNKSVLYNQVAGNLSKGSLTCKPTHKGLILVVLAQHNAPPNSLASYPISMHVNASDIGDAYNMSCNNLLHKICARCFLLWDQNPPFCSPSRDKRTSRTTGHKDCSDTPPG